MECRLRPTAVNTGRPYVTFMMEADTLQRSTHALSRFVLDHLPDPVLVLDTSGNIVESNRAARDGERYSDISEPFQQREVPPSVASFLARLRATGHARLELGRRSSAPEQPPLELRGVAVDRYFIVTLERNAKVAALEGELRQFRRVETLGLLTARLVHDLNNLLLPILLFSRDLTSELEERGQNATLARDIEATAERAAWLVKSVLGFARPRPWRVQPVTLGSVVSALRPLMELITGPDIKLILALDEQPLQVNVDRSQLEQAILNLVSNAKNAMPHGGELTITSTQASLGQQHHERDGLLAPHVVLIVNDTGVGMTDDVQRRAFDPFFTTRAATGGTGLGLTSVQQFVRESHGLIMLDSEAGRGTTIVIHLPRAEKEREAPTSAGLSH